jgi:hypothetical protein
MPAQICALREQFCFKVAWELGNGSISTEPKNSQKHEGGKSFLHGEVLDGILPSHRNRVN